MRTILFLLFISQFLLAQTPEKIKVKKEDEFYFFQVGQRSDTIAPNTNDLFYLKLTGKSRCTTRIEIVNGRLFKTGNDTVFQLKKIPNLQYEHYFMDSVFVAIKPGSKETHKNCFKFVTHINGAHEGDGNTISIQFYNITSKETLLTNTFYYR